VTVEQTIDGVALWYVGPGRVELRTQPIGPPGNNEVRVRALFGAISRGTERLVFRGAVPPSEHQRMRAPLMSGTFPFPVKYGYAAVGRVEGGPPLLQGRNVFALHPHQDVFTLPVSAVAVVPDGVPPPRAVLAANMETALNAVWDAGPGPADRITIVGGGVVGLLIARLCARLPGADVTVVDVEPTRAEIAHALGVDFALPGRAKGECDLVFHASGHAAGLATALRLAGEEASVVEVSWYGAGDVAVPLGEAFHSRRLRLLSSQVGQVSPSRRPRWSHARRLQAALGLLDDPVLDALLAPATPFVDLPSRIAGMLGPNASALCPLISYQAELAGR
jgi:NADPH:quinone reductase-like Zn-dependent oxidoreductase